MFIVDLDFDLGVQIKYIIMHGCTNKLNGFVNAGFYINLKKGRLHIF